MFLRFLGVIITLSTASFQGMASVNPPVGVVPDWRAPTLSSKKQIFIYYANEVAPDAWGGQNTAKLLDWARQTDTNYGQFWLKRMLSDEENFARAVTLDMQQLQDGLVGTPLGQRTGAMFMTNSLAHRAKVLILEPGATALREEALPPYHGSDDPRFKSFPLMDAAFLSAFLGFAKSRFQDIDPMYTMVIKSHSTGDFLLTQWSTVRADVMGKAAFQRQIYAQDALREHKQLSEQPQRAAIGEQTGLSKQDFFRIMNGEAARVPHISLLVLESCKNGIDLRSAGDLPSNIELMYTSNPSGLQYETIDYRHVLALSDQKNMAEGLFLHLQKQSLALVDTPYRRSKLWLTRLVYALPILLLLIFWLAEKRRKRS